MAQILCASASGNLTAKSLHGCTNVRQSPFSPLTSISLRSAFSGTGSFLEAKHNRRIPNRRISGLPGHARAEDTSDASDASDTPVAETANVANRLTSDGPLLRPRSVSIPFGDREITVEVGRMGRQANGAVTVTDGETVLYCTVCASEEESEPSDFVPLSVSYQERFSAGGRTSGGYFKREGRPKDHEILVSRLIDRPLRPMVAKGFNHEVQVLSWLFSYDGEHSPDALAITAAGAALAVSDIPLAGIVAGVRVGMVNGALVVNPTNQQLEGSPLDLVVAGTTDSVLMIEGYCNLLSEEQLLEAVAAGQQAISAICRGLHKWTQEVEGVAKPKLTAAIHAPPADLLGRLEGLVGADLEAALRIEGKKQRGVAMKAVEEKVLGALTEAGQAAIRQAAKEEDEEAELAEEEGLVVPLGDVYEGEVHAAKEEDEEAELAEEEGLVVPPGDVDEGEVHVKGTGTGMGKGVGKGKGKADVVEVAYDPVDVKKQLKELTSRIMRRIIVTEGRRSDGRGTSDVRPIESACGVLPRVHGSALFTRGETQALAVATLGGEDSAQRLDHLTATSELKRFYLQYTFPPSSVGETGRAGFTSRREVGHGALAERSLEPVLPDAAGFPYTVRVESTITESNGSSSMASVCGGCLAMLDAGVPLRAPVAGVAMGLILHTEQAGGDGTPVILTDILGSEDALGDMDFKVAGSAKGVTAFQMDIKVQGITIDVMRTALQRAKEGRLHILGEMAKADPPPSKRLSQYAPRCESIQVDPEKVNLIIGSGGKTIKSIIEESGVDSINIEDGGQLRIYARSEAALELARARIEGLTMVPEVGQIYRDCVVKTVVPYGAFVELKPGKEALIHVSELSTVRLNKPEDFVAVGDTLDVKILEINARGQLRLSHKAVLLEEGREPVPTSNASATSTATPNGSSGENRNAMGAGKGGYAPPKSVKPNAPASPSPLVPKPRGR
ncbi:unnamed protein product [Closterium sp. NIES-65]|nr:unnamed protein product [Closterium sp. NIES-65]